MRTNFLVKFFLVIFSLSRLRYLCACSLLKKKILVTFEIFVRMFVVEIFSLSKFFPCHV